MLPTALIAMAMSSRAKLPMKPGSTRWQSMMVSPAIASTANKVAVRSTARIENEIRVGVSSHVRPQRLNNVERAMSIIC